MHVYLVSFDSPDPPNAATEIAHMVGHPGGMKVLTSIKLHSRNRCVADDYNMMVAFSFSAPNTFRLHNLPVYVDDRHTSVFYAKYNMYAIFKSDLSDNAWNIVRHLLPAPDRVFNGRVIRYSCQSMPKGMTFVDTKSKPSVFDEQDVYLNSDRKVM